MSQPASEAPRGRETRLLLGTIVVSVLVLVVLAQFRFPEETAREVVEPSPAPLERLAARATFDELAAIMTDLERRLVPRLTTVRVEPARPSGPLALALRMTPNRAVLLLGATETVAPATDGSYTVIGRDATRDLAVISVPETAEGPVTPRTGATRQGPRYVAVLEPSAQGPVIRPAYLPRTEIIQDPRTDTPLHQVAIIQQTLPRGAALFTLSGTFIGVVTEGGAEATVIPAESMIAAALSVQPGAVVRGDLGLEVQPLSRELARASGADAGVMVSYVQPQGPAAGALQSGDVIASLDSVVVTTAPQFLRLEQSRTPGASVALRIVRRGKPLEVAVTVRDAAAPAQTPEAADPGAVLRTVPDLGVELVAVMPGGSAARAGLQAGDIVVRIDEIENPDAAAVLRAYRAAKPGSTLLFTVQRGSRHLVAAVGKP